MEEKRPSRPSRAKKTAAANTTSSAPLAHNISSDGYEPNIRVPTSVLDGCLESFAAADSNRVKASTTFFADTGLMALLCRHDRVLWLVNMTSAGEKSNIMHSLYCNDYFNIFLKL